MSPAVIEKHQRTDKALQKARTGKTKEHYGTKKLEDVEVITYKNKIYIPVALQQRIVEWYHEYLCHPGENRTEETISQTMNYDIAEFKETCAYAL